MAISIWKRKRLLRRFSDAGYKGGYRTVTHEDRIILIDLQTTDDSMTPDESGDDSVQRLKGFSDFDVRPANSDRSVPGDWIWFQDTWFECISSRLSENTVLKHWTSTWAKIPDQAEAPEGVVQ